MENKLLEIQKEIGAISKDSENPFFKNKYFDINKLLEVVKPVLNNHKIVLLQPLSNVDGKASLKTVLINTADGKKLEYEVTLPEDPNPQKMGSIITYYRRYSLVALLGLQAEDDDANLGSQPAPKKELNPNPRKNEIKKLCDKSNPLLVGSEDYKDWVLKKTQLSLEEKNYDEIIERLKVLTKE